MTTITDRTEPITLGIDTHRDNHVAASLDSMGRVVATETFSANACGYQSLVKWAETFGAIDVAGIEGTGSWGAGLARHVASLGIEVREVNRPNRQHRRRYGKSDTADAVAAARAVQSGEADGLPRGNNGDIEALRTIRVAHRSAHKARTQAINQLRSLATTAPEHIRARLRSLSITELVRTAARFRASSSSNDVTKIAMRSIARRATALTAEINELEAIRDRIVSQIAPPELMAEHGVGPETASNLLIAFGDNPQRVHSEAAFAALCGVSPVDCSSGRNQRHRLNRGGDRQANNALWRIAIVRLAHHQPTRDYMARSLAKGKTKKETIRKLKRYIARHIWRILQHHQPQPAP